MDIEKKLVHVFKGTLIKVVERRKNIYQLITPFYHKDGDMVDVYVLILDNKIRVCDLGKTLMRLSYSYSTDTPVILQNHLNEENGNLYLDLDIENADIYSAVVQFCRTIISVDTNSRVFND